MPRTRTFLLGLTLFALALGGCAGKRKPPEKPVKPPTSEAPHPVSGQAGLSARQRMIKIAEQEWEFFDRQVVRLDQTGESIPHVGKWEDDGEPWSSRVGLYWSVTGKYDLDGFDCKEPWSAAFISWIMRQSGLSSSQFPASDAHWHYIQHFVNRPPSSGSVYVPHKITEYAPRPGDLICATRGSHGFIPVYDASPASVLSSHTKLHCDLVTGRKGNILAAVGGNVRNSVSKSLFTLTSQGRLQPTERRPWFVVLENRLGQPGN